MKTINAWAKEWKRDMLTKRERTLIDQTWQDLMFGPTYEDGYPGFTSAVTQIRRALNELPCTLYVNEITDEVMTDVPEEDDIHEWYKYERSELYAFIIGKDLVQYL